MGMLRIGESKSGLKERGSFDGSRYDYKRRNECNNKLRSGRLSAETSVRTMPFDNDNVSVVRTYYRLSNVDGRG